ncbi:hypothetical protein [Arthrobacter sp. zg-Y1110]|uniref:hypothetical protein n=1 Tax=Arthrobacter sp. zg-Y1110 TaxID=2886932 RepID=UPI001D1446FF|nr:hypothetical protein [Arthrobacter sp. zg-Y1110]MCC3292457.1 hypothetical protein [Arthrobacter sp. zg-Y1110]UWX87110.1 hypothetical protein N2K99_17365 [Arthrobacter sp. zg-Y1110]
MASHLVDTMVSEAFSILNGIGAVHYDYVYETLFETHSEGLTMAEKVVLYPQFKAQIEPELVHRLTDSPFLVLSGGWQRIADHPELEEDRYSGYPTGEEIRILDGYKASRG